MRCAKATRAIASTSSRAGRSRCRGTEQHIAEIGPGDSFGEIALLRDVPRTATVTASSAVVLLALDRRHFIPAVTGHGDAHEAAELVISSRLGLR